MKKSMLWAALPALSLCMSAAVEAYDCSVLPDFSLGQASAGQVYQNNEHAYQCLYDWCAWSTPGVDSWAVYSWEDLGACDTEPEGVAPEASVIYQYGDTLYLGGTYSFAGSGSDADGDIISYGLVVYVNDDGFLTLPEYLDQSLGAPVEIASVELSGEWTPRSAGDYALVVSIADADGNVDTAQHDFQVVDAQPTLNVSHADEIELGESITVTAESFHPVKSDQPTIAIYDPDGVSVASSSSGGSSSGGPSNNWTVQTTLTPATIGEYTVVVSWDAELSLKQDSSFSVTDPNAIDPPRFSTRPSIGYQGQRSSFSYQSWHPSAASAPSVSITGPDGNAVSIAAWQTSGSSSSGGSGYLWAKFTDLFEMPAQIGEYVISAYFHNGGSLQTTLQVLSGYESEPQLFIKASSVLKQGVNVTFETAVFDIYHPETVELLVDGESLGFAGTSPSEASYEIDAEHNWLAEAGSHTLTARVTNDRGDIFEKTQQIDVTPASGCELAGVDWPSVNAYPNWTAQDWLGGPYNHANSGDLMRYEGAVYRALWYTTAVPGAASWEFVCEF
ncbi:putative cellulose-binding protein with CBM 5-12 [Alteromonadaceae bacterium 2753L.S.0a.02]|nr:putative cellulose-binding protein with CBM 5-12 [Alteromonadaceae bacterium 2753L.S.0a.02]